jgi:hypothetical protein
MCFYTRHSFVIAASYGSNSVNGVSRALAIAVPHSWQINACVITINYLDSNRASYYLDAMLSILVRVQPASTDRNCDIKCGILYPNYMQQQHLSCALICRPVRKINTVTVLLGA